MKIEFNVTGSERKSLVVAIGEILEIKPKYLGMPSAAYEVGDFTIDKNGAVVFDGDGDDIETLLANLAQKGFVAEESTNPPTTEDPQHSEDVGLTVAMPREGFTDTAIENLNKLVISKSALIKKALDVEDLPIEVTEDKISFPWFNPQGDAALVRAYAPTIEAGALPVAFGDFSNYWIADRAGRTLQRLNELYAGNGQVGFLATERVDGKVILAEGIQLLQMAGA